MLCRDLKLFSQAVVAIDGSKFKAVNSRDCNFTNGKIDKRQQQIEESIQRYTHFLTRRLPNVSAEVGLNVLAYNFKRVLSILGFEGMMRAMRLAGA
jgi:hypothetical protein